MPPTARLDCNNFDQIESDNSRVSELTRSYLATLADNDLGREAALHLTEDVFEGKVSKILEDAAVDELAQVGDWICLLWQMDIKPPCTDWLGYPVP